VWYGLNDHEKFIYHYTKPKTLVEEILPSKALRFSSFSELNDPREYRKFDLDSFWQTVSPDIHKIEEMEVALKAGWKICCFASDPIEAVIPDGADALQPQERNRIRRRGFCRPRMWAQYAYNHTGACLVFRKELLDKAIRDYARHRRLQVYCGRVSYLECPVLSNFALGPFSFSGDEVLRHGIRRAAELHTARYFRELYLNKNPDWEAEREFRWLLKGSDLNAELIPFGNALVGVALGDKFPEESKALVGKFKAKNDLDVVRMDWRRDFPQPKPLTLRMLLPEGDPDRPAEGW
jgi:hypothetical protein